MISEDTFVSLQVGDSGLAHLPAAVASPWAARLGQTGLTTLRAKGWPAPRPVPANLELFAAHQDTTSPGQVVELTTRTGWPWCRSSCSGASWGGRCPAGTGSSWTDGRFTP